MNYKDAIADNFSKASRTYDEYATAQKKFAQRLKAQILKKAKAARAILDIGTGTGTLALELAEFFPKAMVYGCDIADGMLWVAKEKRDSRGFLNFACMRADVEHLPYPNCTFDLITSNAALHWAADLPLAFSEIMRVLQPWGRFFASIITEGTLIELHESLKIAAQRCGGSLPAVTEELPRAEEIVKVLKNECFSEISTSHVEEKVYYKSARDLLISLKRTGTNYIANRLSRRVLFEAISIYEKEYANKSGIWATYKALFIEAKK